jgi:hypothetical protein
MGLLSYLKRHKKVSQSRSQGWLWGRCYCLSEHRMPRQIIDKDGILKCMTCKTNIAGGYPNE